MTETALVKQCLEYLAFHPRVFCWRQNQGAFAGERTDSRGRTRKRYVKFTSINGISDIMGWVRPGARVLAVECKIKNRPVTTEQQWFLDQVRADGGIALVVRSLDELIDGIAKELK